jgi:hypothetical protein
MNRYFYEQQQFMKKINYFHEITTFSFRKYQSNIDIDQNDFQMC